MVNRIAILLDGEYVKKSLRKFLRRPPTSAQVMAEVARIRRHPGVASHDLYRVYYYTADPLAGTATNPLDGSVTDFAGTVVHRRNRQLIDRIENEPDVAVRRGTLVHQGWEIGRSALRELTRGRKPGIEAGDLVPKIQQKGVDMRIGLDIASLALKRLVGSIVVVSGDSDLVPAMKLARREGLRVYLDTVGQSSVRPELKKHADIVVQREPDGSL